MATAILTISDKADGSDGLDVRIGFDPPLDRESSDHPFSQIAGFAAMAYLQDMFRVEDSEITAITTS